MLLIQRMGFINLYIYTLKINVFLTIQYELIWYSSSINTIFYRKESIQNIPPLHCFNFHNKTFLDNKINTLID